MGEASAPDGARVAYTLHKGSGQGRVALVHSLAMDRSFWDGVVPRLTAVADVVTVDCRGHGASDKPDEPYSVDLFADDLAVVLDAVGWDSAVVAGASMGGCVALAFGQRHPGRTDGLGLFDTTAWYGDDAPEKWAGRAQKALDEGMGALVEFQKTRWFGDAFRDNNPDVLDKALAVFLANDVKAYARTCHMLGACDKRAGLAAIKMPVRIAVGEEDYATPVAMAEAMKAEIPQASMTVIPGARHFTPLEVPEVIAAELTQLLQEAGRK